MSRRIRTRAAALAATAALASGIALGTASTASAADAQPAAASSIFSCNVLVQGQVFFSVLTIHLGTTVVAPTVAAAQAADMAQIPAEPPATFTALSATCIAI